MITCTPAAPTELDSYTAYDKIVPFAQIVGHTLTKIERSEGHITFYTEDGTRFVQYHRQDCCESVTIEDIAGDLKDLIGSPIVQAEESTSNNIGPPDLDTPEGVYAFAVQIGFAPKPSLDHSETWTFYKLATVKGSVTIRWYGASNGYYSESVDVYKLTPER